MKLALGIIFLWIGAAFLSVAVHGIQGSTPWAAFSTIIQNIERA